MKKIWLTAFLAAWSCIAFADELDDLVRQVQESQTRETRIDAERKARFLVDKNQQQKLLAETKAGLAKAETESKALREQFAANQTRLKELDNELKTNSGELNGLFGTVREFSGKLNSDIENSITSSQFPGRTDLLKALAVGEEIPNISQLEQLWFTVLQEMTEAGKTVKFRGTFTDAAGKQREADIYRVGVFAALADDKYLHYVPNTGKLEELLQQPDKGFLSLAKSLRNSMGKFTIVAVDPTRGSILDASPPSSTSISWIPTSLKSLISSEVDIGVFSLLLLASIWAISVAFERWLFFRRVDVGGFPTRAALETELTRHLTVIGTVAANAPFVGLLGTVLGIMLTFQKMSTERGMDVHSIMLGLSVALKATAMGLLVAIPCVVLNNALRRRIREMVTIYEVQRGS